VPKMKRVTSSGPVKSKEEPDKTKTKEPTEKTPPSSIDPEVIDWLVRRVDQLINKIRSISARGGDVKKSTEGGFKEP